jgi:hypothetical protein
MSWPSSRARRSGSGPALGLPAEGGPTQEHLDNIAARKMANGERLDLDAYRRAITGEGARIGYVDSTFSASKAVLRYSMIRVTNKGTREKKSEEQPPN